MKSKTKRHTVAPNRTHKGARVCNDTYAHTLRHTIKIDSEHISSSAT